MGKKKKNSARGVTLIELIIVITTVGVLTAVSSMYIKEVIDLWRFTTFRNELVSQGRMALLRMAREIRQLRDSNSISSADVAAFNFFDATDTAISYQLTGNNLLRNSDILISGVTSLAFTYYDRSNNSLAAPVGTTTQIYRIDITLQLSSGGQTKSLTLDVFPRSL